MAKLLGLVFFIGTLGYFMYFIYQKIEVIGFARANTNYFEGAKNAKSTSLMTLRNCESGVISFLPSLGGNIIIEPQVAKIDSNGKLRITNADNTPHNISIPQTEINKEIQSGGTLEIKAEDLPVLPTLSIICDGINLGDRAPSIILNQL